MTVLFDTSVLVAAMVQAHPMHSRAVSWLKRAKAHDVTYLIASHTLAELYAVLTSLPLTPRIAPATAWRLIHENVDTAATIVPLTTADYRLTLKRLAELGLSGGVVYDAVIARAAQKAQVERLLTLNPEDFGRVWPEGAAIVSAP